MATHGPKPQLCPHGVLGVNKCRECKNDFSRKYRADPVRHERMNENSRRCQRAKRATPEGRQKHNIYMREWNAGGISEREVEEYLIEKVKEKEGLCLKFTSPGRRGAPDRLVLLLGHPTYYVELKRPRSGKLAPHQERYHAAIRAAGQRVWILWSKEDVNAFITEISS